MESSENILFLIEKYYFRVVHNVGLCLLFLDIASQRLYSMGDIDRGKLKYSEKSLFQCHFIHTQIPHILTQYLARSPTVRGL
jgi:hypothetical protein